MILVDLQSWVVIFRTETIKRGREEELLFQKTLTSLDCHEFLAISTANALAHFPSLQTTELGEYSGVETLRMVPLKTPGELRNLKFIYCQNRKSYGIFDGWSDFIKEYKLKEGEMVELYKSSVLDKEYLIDFHKTGNENEEMPLVAKKTIHMYGYDLEYLFEKELSRADVSWLKLLEIPVAEAEEHLPPLKQADGSYKEIEDVLVYDAGKKLHWMEISKRLFGIYYISGQWDDFVSLHKLCDKDIIRFFKLRLAPFYTHYLIDYVRAKRG